MIEAEWRRKNINQQINRIRRAFRWGVSQELVQTEIPASLESVSGLRTGHQAQGCTPGGGQEMTESFKIFSTAV